ncbi:MAG: 50S ribosome-binding GTPase [Clostridia bacterium]|nr:50S ribosome-binding GTPase [Clostridia bacterium]
MDCCQNKQSLFDKVKSRLSFKQQNGSNSTVVPKKVALIGNPNVGKSVIFNSLTGAYVTVSNYPGTTVEVSRGWYEAAGLKLEVIDTPGMYSILPITEEERVTRDLLIDEKPELVIHVMDAKNIERMLPLTLQLIEAGLRVVLLLNIMDEAKTLGIEINSAELQKILGIPVATASAALNLGINDIKKIIGEQIKHAA